jgi:hypothetical protein
MNSTKKTTIRPDYHGWRRGDKATALYIGELPGRKRPYLYACGPTGITLLAQFRSEAAAVAALKLLDGLIPTGAI